jgi:TPR repeat protein
LGDAYAKGELGLKVNYAKAKKYYSQACKAKSAIGCYRLGNLYYKGNGVKKSYVQAKVYYEQSCKSKHLNGTERGCNNLAVLYHYGRGVKKNTQMAKMYYKKSCDKRYDKACETLRSLQ